MTKFVAQASGLAKALWKHAGDWVVVLLILFALVGGFLLRGGDGSVNADAGEEAQQWYTCSMHPDVRMPNPDDLCPICNMELIPLDSHQEPTLGPREIELTPEAAALISVETVPVQRRLLDRPVRMAGRISADETRQSFVTAYMPGRLDRLYVDYTGITVRQGDHLAEIYSPELLVAQQELISAHAAVQAMDANAPPAVRRTNTTLLQTARDKLRLLGLTAEQIDTIANSGQPSDHITLYAPVSGVVTERAVAEGSYVSEGTRLYTLTDLSHVWLMLDAYESDLAWLRYGQEVSFTVEAFGDEPFTGRIAFISPVLDERTRTVRVRVNVDNADGRLRPGMFARGEVHATISSGERVVSPDLAGRWISPMHPEIIKDGPGVCDICGMALVPIGELGYASLDPDAVEPPLVVPASAVLRTGVRGVVYVQTGSADQLRFEGRVVTLGPSGDGYMIITGGLEEGELVAVRGNFQIDSSLQIQARPSMMNQDGDSGTSDPHAGHDHGQAATMTMGPDRSGYYVPPMATVSFDEGLPALLTSFNAASDAVQASDLDNARLVMRDLRQAFTAMPASAPRDHPLTDVWAQVRLGIESGLRQGLVAQNLDELRSALRTIANHIEPLTASHGGRGE